MAKIPPWELQGRNVVIKWRNVRRVSSDEQEEGCCALRAAAPGRIHASRIASVAAGRDVPRSGGVDRGGASWLIATYFHLFSVIIAYYRLFSLNRKKMFRRNHDSSIPVAQKKGDEDFDPFGPILTYFDHFYFFMKMNYKGTETQRRHGQWPKSGSAEANQERLATCRQRNMGRRSSAALPQNMTGAIRS